MGKQKKPSIFKRIIYTIVILFIGLYGGYKLFSPSSGEVPMPVKNVLYRNASGETDESQSLADVFSGEIHEVKNGDLIMDAVKKAKPGDLIRVYPGTYF